MYKKIMFALLGKLEYDGNENGAGARLRSLNEARKQEDSGDDDRRDSDMDGLLLDPGQVYQENWMETARRFGQVPVPAFATAVSGTTGEEQRRVIRRHYPDVDPLAFQRDCISRVDGILNRQCAPEKPGAREILEFFRARGGRTAVTSSGRDRIWSNLRQRGLEDLFDAVVSGQEAAHGEPEPDIFLLAAKQIGCVPEECCVFEDSLNGVRAGMAAGCVTVTVPDLVRPTGDLAVHKICASLNEARALIEQGRL